MVIAPQTSIAIIGGGIGGLTVALSLLRAGFDVQVYEQVSKGSMSGLDSQFLLQNLGHGLPGRLRTVRQF
jgi:2-polyprenyl-6-methoxyphenol hydroxylase-like FAD-dependent oxidoreductase